jgi:flagellar basal-body rod modification protein FlgD
MKKNYFLLFATLSFISINVFANDALTNSHSKAQLINSFQPATLVGKKAEMTSNISPLYKNEGLKGAVILPAAAKDVVVTITAEQGTVMKSINLGSFKKAGTIDFSWNGVDAEGKPCDPDFYAISASATINGQNVKLDTVGAFKINGISNVNKEIVLYIDGMGNKRKDDVIKIL